MLRRANRLRHQSDFRRIYARGKTMTTPSFVVKMISGRHQGGRIGIVVGSKVSKRATARNLLRRRIREVTRTLLSGLPAGIDLVIIARPNALDKSYAAVAEELSGIPQRARTALKL